MCPGCGLVAPSECDFCAVCDTRFAHTRPNAPWAADGSYWVALEVRFECRSCGQSAPLNHLDVDGAVKCMHCGAEQRFDAERWTPLLAQAHAVGDLAGARGVPGLAPLNAYASIGKRETLMAQERPPLRIRMAPGHPLCSICRSPIVISARTAERVTTSCPGCRDTRVYELPVQARGRFRGLLGVLGPEHEQNRRDVKMEMDAGGALLIKCPNCTAPLAPSREYSVTNCQYCGVACRITPEAMWRAGIKSLRADWWWVLFQGPSEERQRLQATAKAVQPIPFARPHNVQIKIKKPAASAVRTVLFVLVSIGLLTSGVVAVVVRSIVETARSVPSLSRVSQLSDFQWNGTQRAVPLDVNGDGVFDFVGRVRRLQPSDVIAVAALNGKDGSELWRSAELGSYSAMHHTPLAITGAVTLVASDQADLFALSTRDGSTLWHVKLNEKIRRICRADSEDKVVIETADEQRYQLELNDGSAQPLPASPAGATPPCTVLPGDGQSNQRAHAIEYEWSNEYRELVLRDKLPGISSDAALHHVAKGITIGLGHKHPGSRIPMLAAYRWPIQDDPAKLSQRQRLLKRARGGPMPAGEPQLLWQTLVPAIDPLTADEDDPEPHSVDFSDEVVVVAYETKKTHIFHLTAFSLDTGTRKWDIALPGDRPMGGVIVSPTHAVVSRWGSVMAFELGTGAQAWSHGPG